MDLIVACTPKNFQVHEMFSVDTNGNLIPVDTLEPGQYGYIDYFFGGKLYRHIGTWPIETIVPKFIVPLKCAFFVDTDTGRKHECTEFVRRHQGPTQSQVIFDEYVPRPHVTWTWNERFSLKIRLKWTRKRHVKGMLYTVNVLGQMKTHIVK